MKCCKVTNTFHTTSQSLNFSKLSSFFFLKPLDKSRIINWFEATNYSLWKLSDNVNILCFKNDA